METDAYKNKFSSAMKKIESKTKPSPCRIHHHQYTDKAQLKCQHTGLKGNSKNHFSFLQMIKDYTCMDLHGIKKIQVCQIGKYNIIK